MLSPLDRAAAVADLAALVHGEGGPGPADVAGRYGEALLPLLEQQFARDQPFEALERLERVLKHLVRAACAAPAAGPDARALARSQQRIGLLFKYKSYTVKAAHPLGYSIFLQTPGQGFSFQQHVTHKVEVFHVLDVHAGGYVFLCDYADWLQVYEREAFARWFAGEPNPAFERFRFFPLPGDVIPIDRLNVVHTVIGCTIEEFATTSTDMVDRLHDQNPRDRIPAHFTREYSQARLAALAAPRTPGRRVLLTPAGFEACPLTADPVAGGERVVLEDRFLTAARHVVRPGDCTAPEVSGEDAVAAYVLGGSGMLAIAGPGESVDEVPPIAIRRGDALLVTAGTEFRFGAAPGIEPLVVSQHRARYDTLLAG